MLTTEKERKTCAEYSKPAGHEKNRCMSCPLKYTETLCKAIAHYNRRTGQYEIDWR